MTTLHTDVHRHFAAYFKAGILEPYLFHLSKSMSDGHICISIYNMPEEALREIYPGFKPDIYALKSHPLVSDGTTYKPFVLDHGKLYLQRYYHYEKQIIEKISALIHFESEHIEERKNTLIQHKPLIDHLFPNEIPNLTNWPKVAALSAMLHQFTIITGGPGTGKTTTVAKILSLLFALQPDLRVALAAPTGKAANRMAESLKNAIFTDVAVRDIIAQLTPSTIHRLLGSKRDSIYFKHNKENPLPFDLVIIDESSMIDIALFSKLLDAIHPATKIIFLGDKDQLASVEAGSLFGDLCMAQGNINNFSADRIQFFNHFSENHIIPTDNQEAHTHLLFEHVIELQYSHRFSSDGGIGKLSKAIIQSHTDDISSLFAGTDEQVKIDATYSEAIFKKFVQGYQAYIQEPDLQQAFKKLNTLRILCAVREGDEGVIHVNEQVEKQLQSMGLIKKDAEFYENRPIIITKNNYELGLYNGDIGIVRRDTDGKTRVWFEQSEGQLIKVLPASINSAETVFAMTIHKSQGSEFNEVLVILPKQEAMTLLTRELLYTGVTRAKNQVIIQGTHMGILHCASQRVQRGSGIIDRLSSNIHPEGTFHNPLKAD